MLTAKQPSSYGYKSVHDLPTPPPTSRPSPPLAYQSDGYHSHQPVHPPYEAAVRTQSPTSQPMSAPHRGLPPPAAMALPPQPAAPAPGPSHHSQPPPPERSHHHQSHSGSWSSLPAPPQHWHGSEESMKTWLQARAEEEKTRQEEERTRQESLRLEQRRVEMDILRASLGGGIPPPMVPLVFAGMGTGVMPQAALEWAQQFMQSQGHGTPALPGVPPPSEHHRESSGSGLYTGSASQGPGRYGSYPGSPTRSRAVIPGGRPAPPGLNTGVPQPVPLSMSAGSTSQGQSQVHGQQETSPSIYFHHWQPPTSQPQSGGSARPGSPSGEIPRKRKATGQQEPAPVPSQQRFRTPPPRAQTSSANPSPGKRGHRRQRSDVTWYTHTRPTYPESESHAASREPSPGYSREPPRTRETDSAENKKYSVSSMLTGESRGTETTTSQTRRTSQ